MGVFTRRLDALTRADICNLEMLTHIGYVIYRFGGRVWVADILPLHPDTGRARSSGPLRILRFVTPRRHIIQFLCFLCGLFVCIP